MARFELTDEHGNVIAQTDGGAADLAKALGEGWSDLTKAHVKGFTRKDGSFVKEHDDKRAAAKPDERTPHFGAHHAKLAASSKEGDLDHEFNQTAAGHMRAGDKQALAGSLRQADTGARDHVLDHIHPDHWEGLGFRPLDHEGAKAKFEKKFGSAPADNRSHADKQQAAKDDAYSGENEKEDYGVYHKPGSKVRDNKGKEHEVLKHRGAEVVTTKGDRFHPTKLHPVKGGGKELRKALFLR